jgi:hypothetical protein
MIADMAPGGGRAGGLLAVGDLHITYPKNRILPEPVRA